MPTTDYFLKIDGIPGDSTDPRHRGEIELESIEWSGLAGGQSAGAGGTGGSASMQDFRFVARTSSASPRLSRACATGELLSQAILTARRDDADFLHVTLTNVLVASYAVSTSQQSGDPIDDVSLSFENADVESSE
jgi:type VI secretion system secreted protein Hcp